MTEALCSFLSYWIFRLGVWAEDRVWVRPYWDRKWHLWRVAHDRD